jgi:hypothetical protein
MHPGEVQARFTVGIAAQAFRLACRPQVTRGTPVAPGLAHGSIGPDEAKAGPVSQEAVHVGIADVIGGFGPELRLHITEPVLQRREVDDDVMALPEVALVTERAVATASNDRAQRIDASHHWSIRASSPRMWTRYGSGPQLVMKRPEAMRAGGTGAGSACVWEPARSVLSRQPWPNRPGVAEDTVRVRRPGGSVGPADRAGPGPTCAACAASAEGSGLRAAPDSRATAPPPRRRPGPPGGPGQSAGRAGGRAWRHGCTRVRAGPAGAAGRERHSPARAPPLLPARATAGSAGPAGGEPGPGPVPTGGGRATWPGAG